MSEANRLTISCDKKAIKDAERHANKYAGIIRGDLRSNWGKRKESFLVGWYACIRWVQEKAAARSADAPGEESSPYCPECGSCGEIGCCGPRRCHYPTVNAEEVEAMDKVAEEAMKERDEARAELSSLKATEAALRDELTKARADADRLSNIATADALENIELKEQVAALREDNDKLKRLAFDNKAAIDHFSSERDTLRRHNASLSEQLAEATKALEYVEKGCPTKHPECTCVLNKAQITLAKLKAPSDKDAGECKHESYISDRGLPYCKHCHARMEKP